METRVLVKSLLEKIPAYVFTVAQTLRAAGFEAHLVGGSLRDLLVGRVPQDYDIATNAYPEEITALFEKSVPTGAKFGTILVLIPDETGETREIEVTTYRSEADYVGGRWPTKVEFTKTIDQDLARRDFTINALALRLDDQVAEAADIVDLFGGLADLEAKTIRAVGNAEERFREDGLRAYRACRLAANLGFTIEPETFAAIGQTLEVSKQVSLERVRDELLKLLYKSPQPSQGFLLLRDSGLLELFLPELLATIDIRQPEYHNHDVFMHTLRTVDLAADSVKLAALFHDIGKPATMMTDEKGTHFYGHDQTGAKLTEEIMRRLRFSNAEIERTATLVKHHMFYYPAADWRKETLPQLPAADRTTLIFLRHAEFETAGELSEAGQAQLDYAGERLKVFAPQAVMSSPVARAQHTATLLTQTLGLPTETLGLQENLELRRSGESEAAFAARIRLVLQEAIVKHWGEVIVLVTHQDVVAMARQLLVDVSDLAAEDRPLEYAEYAVAHIDEHIFDPGFLSQKQIEHLRAEQEDSELAGGWKDSAVRRFIRNVGGAEMVQELIKLRIADASSNTKTAFNPHEMQLLAERVSAVLAKDVALSIADLAIGGQDLMSELQIPAGPQIGRILNELLEKVIDEPKLNEREQLLQLAREIVAVAG